MDQFDWAGVVCQEVSAPVTTNNEQNMARWMAAENPPSDWYHKNNPLNVADFVTDSQSFPTIEAAAQATANVILQPNMHLILQALRSDASLQSFSAACAAAPWSTGGYHGNPGYIASIPLPPSVQYPGTTPTPTPQPEVSPMPVTQAVNYHAGTLNHVFQQSGGSLWHKYQDMTGAWHNECLGGPNGGVANAKATFVGQPEVAVINSQCCVTVEDNSNRAWYFAQTSGSSTWGVNQLP
jgi:hypothetical protein